MHDPNVYSPVRFTPWAGPFKREGRGGSSGLGRRTEGPGGEAGGGARCDTEDGRPKPAATLKMRKKTLREARGGEEPSKL
jgi:hypothetical protein